MSEQKPEHGTLQAYVTGFVLSLVFTFIPYYLVVNQSTKGTALLLVILGFGVLQMLVQVLFFLHLGRRPRPWWQIIFFVMTVASILIVIGGSLIITTNLHHSMSPSEQIMKLTNDEGIYQIGGKKTGACQGKYPNHRVTITDNLVTPKHTKAKKCDTLTFMNHGTEVKEITFGEYPNRGVYAGETEYIIRAGQNKTITLSEAGTYEFHDHLLPKTAGSFTVR